MSGAGAPDKQAFDASDLKVAVVAASWHDQVMDGLLVGARRALAEHRVADPLEVRVPGTFELPVVAAALAAQGYDAVVALGVVIRGGTPHFDYVCSAATDGLTRVALDHGVAVGFGVLTCDDDAAGAGPGRLALVAGGQGLRGHLGRAGDGSHHQEAAPRCGRGPRCVRRTGTA